MFGEISKHTNIAFSPLYVGAKIFKIKKLKNKERERNVYQFHYKYIFVEFRVMSLLNLWLRILNFWFLKRFIYLKGTFI